MGNFIRLRQIALVAPRLAPTVDAMRAVFGLEPCFRDEAVGKYGLENALYVFGSSFLEIVAPTREGTAAGWFLERYDGLGGYMAIFDTSGYEPYRDNAARLGVQIVNTLDYEGFHGVQLHPRQCRAAMLEFDRTDGNESLDGHYHPAGPDWLAGRRADRAAAISAIEVSSPDPQGLAKNWAALSMLPLAAAPDGTPVLRPDLTEIRFVRAAQDRPELLSAMHVTVDDDARVRGAASAAGLTVVGSGFMFCGVRIEPHKAGSA